MLAVRDIMVPAPVAISPEKAAAVAARLMLECRINCLVVRLGDTVVGIVTPRDLMRGTIDTSRSSATVADLMTPNPMTIDVDASFEEAMQLMDEAHIRHLPVIEDERLVGMLSVRDLMRHRAEYLEGLVRQQTADLERQNTALEERERHMRYHLDLAGRIQQQLLPDTVPDLTPLSLAVEHHPLARVSGDWYDLVPLSEHRIGILIADACGHGVPAAFISVMARAVFQAYGRRARSPATMLWTMNERLPELIREEHFLTMCYAVVDRRTRELTYAMAGHPAPLWYHHDGGTVEPLPGTGDIVGIMPDPSFDERTIRLGPRDAILFYTDGLVESRDGTDRAFGHQRVSSVMLERLPSPSMDLVREIDTRLHEFCGSRGLEDDATWIALTVDDGEAGTKARRHEGTKGNLL